MIPRGWQESPLKCHGGVCALLWPWELCCWHKELLAGSPMAKLVLVATRLTAQTQIQIHRPCMSEKELQHKTTKRRIWVPSHTWEGSSGFGWDSSCFARRGGQEPWSGRSVSIKTFVSKSLTREYSHLKFLSTRWPPRQLQWALLSPMKQRLISTNLERKWHY